VISWRHDIWYADFRNNKLTRQLHMSKINRIADVQEILFNLS